MRLIFVADFAPMNNYHTADVEVKHLSSNIVLGLTIKVSFVTDIAFI